MWCDERQIRRSRSLEIRTEDENWGVFATRRYGVGEICEYRTPSHCRGGLNAVCQIPKTAVLSIKTSSLPQLIPLERFQPQNSHTIFYLSLCLLHEFRLGKESAFYGYLQCLPRDTPLLPSFWSIEELAGQDGLKGLEMIRGTEVERHVQFKANEGLSMVSFNLSGPADCRTMRDSSTRLYHLIYHLPHLTLIHRLSFLSSMLSDSFARERSSLIYIIL